MTPFRIVFAPSARAEFCHLPPQVKPVVKKLLSTLARDPYSGKPLQDEFHGLYNARYQRWRVIYTTDDNAHQIIIHLIERRVTVYDTLKAIMPLKVQERMRAGYAPLHK